MYPLLNICSVVHNSCKRYKSNRCFYIRPRLVLSYGKTKSLEFNRCIGQEDYLAIAF